MGSTRRFWSSIISAGTSALANTRRPSVRFAVTYVSPINQISSAVQFSIRYTDVLKVVDGGTGFLGLKAWGETCLVVRLNHFRSRRKRVIDSAPLTSLWGRGSGIREEFQKKRCNAFGPTILERLAPVFSVVKRTQNRRKYYVILM